MVKLFTFILKTILTRFTMYLPTLVDMVKEYRVNSNKSRNIKKSRKNKIFEIIAKKLKFILF